MISCEKNYSVLVAPASGPHGPPHGPLQVSANIVGILNSAMDYLNACNHAPPQAYLTGFLIWNGVGWTESNGGNFFNVDSGIVGFELQIDVGSGSFHNEAGTLSADPIGNITWTSSGYIVTVCGCVPGFPLSGGSLPPVCPDRPAIAGSISWA